MQSRTPTSACSYFAACSAVQRCRVPLVVQSPAAARQLPPIEPDSITPIGRRQQRGHVRRQAQRELRPNLVEGAGGSALERGRLIRYLGIDDTPGGQTGARGQIDEVQAVVFAKPQGSDQQSRRLRVQAGAGGRESRRARRGPPRRGRASTTAAAAVTSGSTSRREITLDAARRLQKHVQSAIDPPVATATARRGARPESRARDR